MSTRSQIGIYKKDAELTKPDVLIYRHSDGYSEAVLPEILPFLKDFKQNRGLDDTEYAGARLVQHLCNKNDKENYNKYIGYGISKELHGDIKYYYAIYPNKIDVYSAKAGDYNSFEFIKKIKITT